MVEITEEIQKKFIDIAKSAILGDRSWVLFTNGTFIIIKDKVKDLTKAAIEFITQNGRVAVGTPMTDFSIMDLSSDDGWIITSWKEPMMTIVLKDELSNQEIDDISAGMYGRHKRDLDAKNPKILYVNK